MKIKTISINKFRRFENLTISDLPPAKLVILAGPNGSGKSSIFDAFSIWHQVNGGLGLSWDSKYHQRDEVTQGWKNQVQVEFHEPIIHPKKTFYIRTAYRNDPEFELNSFSKLTAPDEQLRIRRMIEQDGTVTQNYQRLAADAFENAFQKLDENLTMKAFRESAVGEIGAAVRRLFPNLDLNTLGNPLTEGTFRFTKGNIEGFSYKNLSGGEKAAFDLLLDMLVKRRTFDNTVFVIDEPETHINTRIQGKLLEELFNLIPDGSQMWVATHSIGMMRKARELYNANPSEVLFLDFEDHVFDGPVIIKPTVPNRAFWERILRVALDDLADLVAPREIIICEGTPMSPSSGKNEAHDARCYEIIFSDQYLDTKFISGGSSKEVQDDRLRFAKVFPTVVQGIAVRRLIDRDDHASAEIANFKVDGTSVLGRRHIEAYLYCEEVLRVLYDTEGKLSQYDAMLTVRSGIISESIARGNPTDDVKSAAPQICAFLKKDLQITGRGDDPLAFARNVLAPLIRPGMTIYEELRTDIFGQ
jgi:predicted ATPase